MFNFYLYCPSYVDVDPADIEDNLIELNEIAVENTKDDDTFLIHASLYDVQTAVGSFAEVIFAGLNDKQFAMTVLPRLLQSFKHTDTEILSFESFDEQYKLYNAFYGVNFSTEEPDRCVTNKAGYDDFRSRNIWEVDAKTCWARREQLFDRITFCDRVENDLLMLGGTYLLQMMDKLQQLNNYVKEHWKQGDFDFSHANFNSSLNISPESKSTMSQEKYKNERMFPLPDGRRECFELHIKTGNLRFHFFPEDNRIYLGYIGKHLRTSRFN